MFLGFRRGDAPGKPRLAIWGDSRSRRLCLCLFERGLVHLGGGVGGVELRMKGMEQKRSFETRWGSLPWEKKKRVPAHRTRRKAADKGAQDQKLDHQIGQTGLCLVRGGSHLHHITSEIDSEGVSVNRMRRGDTTTIPRNL